MPPISVLIKPASGMCNMRCDYCFYSDEMKKRTYKSYGFMTEQTLKNVIRKTMLRAEDSITYAYQGGEPTLCGISFFEKAISFQMQYNKHRIRVNNVIQTNGYAIDETWCRFWKENQFLVGISVDGMKELHDTWRHDKNGYPTYDKILSAIELLERYEVDYNILTVVNGSTAEKIEEIYGEYRKKGWKYQQYIACLDPLGEEHAQREYALKPDVYGRFLIKLFELWYEDRKKGTEPYIRQFENYIGILRGFQPEACEQRGVCGIHNVVEADGSVYPCDFYMTDEYYLGNFNKDRMEKINEKRKNLKFLERSQKLKEECRDCPYYVLCRGGCQRNRDWEKKTDVYKNYFCSSYQMFFKACLGRLEETAK